MKKRNLKTLDAEIVEVYSRQLSRDSKILTSSKYTYYPVVRYKLDGKDNLRRCNINSSSDKSFKAGEHMTLYYDEEYPSVPPGKHRKGAYYGISLGLYEKAIPVGLSFPKMFDITREGGFDRLEISIEETDWRLARLDWSPEKQRELAVLARAAGTPIRTMCLSGHRKYPLAPMIRRSAGDPWRS